MTKLRGVALVLQLATAGVLGIAVGLAVAVRWGFYAAWLPTLVAVFGTLLVFEFVGRRIR